MEATEFIKNTKDYKKLVETIEILKKQRDQSIHDIYILKNVKEEAIQNPTEFVENLINNKLPKFPIRQNIVNIPFIDLNMYIHQNINNEHNNNEIKKEIKLENNNIIVENNNNNIMENNTIENNNNIMENYYNNNKNNKNNTIEHNNNINLPKPGEVIRGRVYTPEKPKSFNQLWTPEEQKRLEELLLIYPDEGVAAKRWKKIAAALGNRTPKQVASRTQKYFIKLAMEGKPVPGKLPNLEFYLRGSSQNRRKKKKNTSTKPNKIKKNHDESYYTPPPVPMSDDEEDFLDPDLKNLDPELKETQEYKELIELMKLQKNEIKKNEKIVEKPDDDLIIHHGYKCDCCGIEPIMGIRWNCKDCPEDIPIDLCENCYKLDFEKQKLPLTHKKEHKLEKVEDIPYFLKYNHEYSGTETNYLDPSFMST